jgi:hypothetical protein
LKFAYLSCPFENTPFLKVRNRSFKESTGKKMRCEVVTMGIYSPKNKYHARTSAERQAPHGERIGGIGATQWREQGLELLMERAAENAK